MKLYKGRNSMNISGVARSYMSRHLGEEDFLIHVSKTVERQLQEWDGAYEVIIMKLENYEWNVKLGDDYFHIELSEKVIHELQHRDPYALDRKLWKDLQEQGLKIVRGYGNYLDFVL